MPELAAALQQIDVCRYLGHNDADLSTLTDKVSAKVADVYAATLWERLALRDGTKIPRNTKNMDKLLRLFLDSTSRKAAG